MRPNSEGSPDLIYGSESSRKKAPGRLNLSPTARRAVVLKIVLLHFAAPSCGNILNETSCECDVTFLFASVVFCVTVPFNTK